MGYFSERKKLNETKRALEQAKAENELARMQSDTLIRQAASDTLSRVTNSGYSHGGAARTAPWAKKYDSESLSPSHDIEENRKLLRERSRDLAMNDALAAAAINSTRTNVVGSGLKPKPKIDYEFLGISRDEALRLQTQIKNEFAIWVDQCDVNDQSNFYELQQIAMLDWLKNGEEFCLVKYEKPTLNAPYSLRLKLIEADRVCTKGSLDGDYYQDDKLPNGSIVSNGIEIDKNGKVVAYHICSSHPGDYSTIHEWTRVERRGKRTGDLQVLHLFNAERAEQYRGVPFLAPVIQTLKQVSRYTEAEIMAAVLNSMLALFVQADPSVDIGGYSGVDEEDEQGESSAEEFLLGSGTVNFLKPGESIVPVESKHPGGNYGSFIDSMANQIGAALEVAPEVILKKFQNNFSASKGALNETWKAYRERREWFVMDFCQAVYELWFSEAVATGRINAPGYFLDPLIRKAYTNATWNGPVPGQLDPVKEVNAAISRINNGLSTRGDECASMNGSDFDDNVRTLEFENQKMADANKYMQPIGQSTGVSEYDEDTDSEQDR